MDKARPYGVYIDLVAEFPRASRDLLLESARHIARGGDRSAWLAWATSNGPYPLR